MDDDQEFCVKVLKRYGKYHSWASHDVLLLENWKIWLLTTNSGDEILTLCRSKAKELMNQNNVPKALGFYAKALQIAEESNNKREEMRIIFEIGVAYYMQGNLDQALEYYEKNVALKIEHSPVSDQVSTLNNIGIVYHDKNGLDEARKYYEQALALQGESASPKSKAYTLNNIGEIYFEKGRLDQ